MVASDACLVVSEGLLSVTWLFVVNKGIASFESQFLNRAERLELVHEVFPPDVSRELAHIELRLTLRNVVIRRA